MKVSVHTADVKNVLRAYSIDVSASSPNDLKQVSRVSPSKLYHESRLLHYDCSAVTARLISRMTLFNVCVGQVGLTMIAQSSIKRSRRSPLIWSRKGIRHKGLHCRCRFWDDYIYYKHRSCISLVGLGGIRGS